MWNSSESPAEAGTVAVLSQRRGLRPSALCCTGIWSPPAGALAERLQLALRRCTTSRPSDASALGALTSRLRHCEGQADRPARRGRSPTTASGQHRFAGLDHRRLPAYAYPRTQRHVVQALIDAGAIPVGKTNLDQFATGLVGTRSPHGACSSVFDKRYISGGSSSGSAVAVARAWSSFSLGTDTAGSGRVPAAFNNLVGLKPTRGLLSTRGVVPACRTSRLRVDLRPQLPRRPYRLARRREASTRRTLTRATPRPGEGAAPWSGGAFRFGVPAAATARVFR